MSRGDLIRTTAEPHPVGAGPAVVPDRFAQVLIAGGRIVERYGLRMVIALAGLLVLMAVFRQPGQWPVVGVLSLWFWGALALTGDPALFRAPADRGTRPLLR